MKKNTDNIIKYERSILYPRVSSQKQVTEGNGLHSQEYRCEQHSQYLGLKEVAARFPDEGVSGALLERPGFRAMLQYMDDHPNEWFIVIIDDLKRLARDVNVYLQLKIELKKRHAKLECPNFKFEDTPENRFVETLMAATGQLEREQNKRQVIQKMRARLEAGYWPFCPPPGMKNVDKVLTSVEPFIGIYKQAIEAFRDYKLNTLEAFRQFILEQYQLHNINRPLSLNGAQKILSQILYTGYLEYLPWGIERMKGKHTGFISLETHLAVLDKLANKSKPRLRKDYSDDFPLRGYLLCTDCKAKITASWHKGKSGIRYPHYWCKTKGCAFANKTVPRLTVEDQFNEVLTDYTPHPEILNFAEALFNKYWDGKQQAKQDSIKAAEKQISALTDEIKACMSRIGKVSSEMLIREYEAQIKELGDKKAALEADINKIKYRNIDVGTISRTVFGAIKEPLKQWEKPRYQDKRLVLSLFLERGIPYDRDTGFGTPELPLIIKVSSQKTTSKNNLVEMMGVKPMSKSHSQFTSSQD